MSGVCALCVANDECALCVQILSVHCMCALCCCYLMSVTVVDSKSNLDDILAVPLAQIWVSHF